MSTLIVPAIERSFLLPWRVNRLHSLKTAVFGGSEFSEDVDIYAFMLESGSLGRVVKALK